MIHIQLNEASVPALGFGTYTLQGETCKKSVADTIAMGYRHIDTAEMQHISALRGNRRMVEPGWAPAWDC